MSVHLVVEITDDLLQSISDGGTVTVRLARGGGAAAPREPAPDRAEARANTTRYRKGSHAQKLLAWAQGRGGEFAVADVVDTLGVTRSHASMILNKLVNDGGPVHRVGRGVYGLEGGSTAAPAVRKKARKKTRRHPTAKKKTTKERTKRRTTKGRSS